MKGEKKKKKGAPNGFARDCKRTNEMGKKERKPTQKAIT